MFERALNVCWILLGAAAAANAWSIGLSGPAGPESGLFPFLAGLIVAASGAALLALPSQRAAGPAWPVGAARGRVLGVVAGLAFMAFAIPYLGFAAAALVTMMVLLRAVERSGWAGSVALAIGAVAGVMWLFGHALGMPLPRGPWGW